MRRSLVLAPEPRRDREPREERGRSQPLSLDSISRLLAVRDQYQLQRESESGPVLNQSRVERTALVDRYRQSRTRVTLRETQRERERSFSAAQLLLLVPLLLHPLAVADPWASFKTEAGLGAQYPVAIGSSGATDPSSVLSPTPISEQLLRYNITNR